jgi:CelD/BcsL family acetyltransferase involved in cellulose biosynthesis
MEAQADGLGHAGQDDGRAAARRLVYVDLGATVVSAPVAPSLTDEVERLYGRHYSTLDYITVFDDLELAGAVLLEGPRHVLLFALRQGTLDVLTRRFPIAPDDARRACLALLRAFPRARLVHLEVLFPPAELGLPSRSLYSADNMVLTLPDDLESYLASLGSSTHRNLRTYENRVRRDFPDLSTTIAPVGERAGELFELYLTWKRPTLKAKGINVFFDQLPDRRRRFVELLRRRGEAHVTTAGGRVVALVFTFPTGRGLCLAQYAYDPELSYYHFGLLSQYWVTVDAIARGMTHIDLLPGTSQYKERLGARPERGTNISVFRSQSARLHSLDEAWTVGRYKARERGSAVYWSTRHAAGRSVRSLFRR